MNLSPRRIAVVFLAPLAFVLGCDMGMQQQLDDAKTQRYAKAKAAVYGIEKVRTAEFEASFPKPGAKAGEDGVHPMLAWRQASAKRSDDQNTLKALGANAKPKEGMTVGALGTPSQHAAELGASFAREATAYWEPGALVSLDRYQGFLRAFIDEVDGDPARLAEVQKILASPAAKEMTPEELDKLEQRAHKFAYDWPPPMYDEAHFDQIFAHAARFYQIGLFQNQGAAITKSLADWAVAFDFPLAGGEGYSDFVGRICFVHKELRPLCKGVPHENRPVVVHRAYLKALKQRADEFKVKRPENKLYETVVAQIAASLAAALEGEPTFQEDPVLPSVAGGQGGTGGLRAVFSKTRGVLLQKKLVPAEYETVAATFRGNLPGGFAAATAAHIETLKNATDNQLNWQHVVVEAPGSQKTGWVRDLVRALPPDNVKKVVFLGRRRLDESLRLSGVTMTLPDPESGATMGYKFNEDTTSQSCARMGFVGSAPLSDQERFFLEVTPTEMRLAEAKVVEGEWQIGDTQAMGSPKNLAKLHEFVGKHPGAQFRTFLPASFSYDESLLFLTQLLYECKDVTYTSNGEIVSELADGQEGIVQTCGRQTSRDVTVYLGICGG